MELNVKSVQSNILSGYSWFIRYHGYSLNALGLKGMSIEGAWQEGAVVSTWTYKGLK